MVQFSVFGMVGQLPRRLASLAALFAAVSLLGGCSGGDDFSTASVSGTVTMNGKPVTGGTIMLTPIAKEGAAISGKPAAGTIQKDGTFVLTTYDEGDGAVVGKHRVSYTPPRNVTESPAGGHGAQAAPSPYSGAKVQPQEVEITSGNNELEIKLVK